MSIYSKLLCCYIKMPRVGACEVNEMRCDLVAYYIAANYMYVGTTCRLVGLDSGVEVTGFG